MAKVLICRGIPACGKSTYSKEWVLDGPNRMRVCRDEIRQQVFGVDYGCDEDMVSRLEKDIIRRGLFNGYDVIVDATNINVKFLANLVRFASNLVILTSDIVLLPFPVYLDEALRRNAARDRVVPEEVIRRMSLDLDESINLTVNDLLEMEF